MTPQEQQTEKRKDEKTAGFMRAAYSWLSELFIGLTDKLTKNTFKVDVSQLDILKNIKEIKGIDGEKGEKGDKGEKGEKGEKGKDGTDGKDGMPGKQGKQGNQGIRGEDGKDGIDGKNGKDGKSGKDGKDGKPATTKEVIEALKKGLLDTTHIKGLEQRLAVSRQRMYGVGPSGALLGVAHDGTIVGDGTEGNPLRVVGGGGAPTTETPAGDINGVNTTYTITAATTHHIYHNGVLLEEGAGNDYTISGTVLEMEWAPESGKLTHIYWA